MTDNPDESERQRQLLSIFRTESAQRVRTISETLSLLEDPLLPPTEHRKLLETCYRDAHSLKGAGRTVHCEPVESIGRAIENAFYALIRKSGKPSEDLLSTVRQGLTLAGSISASGVTATQGEESRALVEHLEAIAKKLIQETKP